MVGGGKPNASLLARVNFPLYTVKVVTERHILVAGGGGASKTGITNSIDVYELVSSGESHTCHADRVVHYDTGSRAIMNSTIFEHDGKTILAAGGPEGRCEIYELKLAVKRDGDQKLNGPRNKSPNGHANGDYRERADSDTLRRRRTSSTSSNIENHHQENGFVDGAQARRPSKPLNGELKEKMNGGPKSNSKRDDDSFPNVTFDVVHLNSVQTDFFPSNPPKDEPFQKIVRYSERNNCLFTGGADGHIRVWRYPDLRKVADFAAHQKDVDDLDIDPSGTKMVSISRDGHGYVWDLKTRNKICELLYTLPAVTTAPNTAPVKYIFRACRYGTVEGNDSQTKIFTIINPLTWCKPPAPSYLCKWDTQRHTVEKMINAGCSMPTAMSISEDGKYIGVGTQPGDVDIYIAYSLQRLYHIDGAHKQFVTGVEFLKSCSETRLLCGDQDASLLSISVDNHIVVHHVPKQATLGFLGSSFLFIVTLLLAYALMDFLGL